MAYQISPLSYAYDALEPCIDSETMRIHHDKHHQAYVDLLNKAVEHYPQFDNRIVEDLLEHLGEVPEEIRTAVRNDGGGHANHEVLWKTMGPPNDSIPRGMLGEAIRNDFGSFESLQERMTEAAARVFGSGWVFLAIDPRGQRLELMTLPNQDSPSLFGKVTLLACDVWEHSYYLKYRNRRPDYLKAWWKVVQWDAVNGRMETARREALVLQ